MTEPFSPDGPQQILTDLRRLAAERVPAEETIANGLKTRNEAAEQAFQDGIAALTVPYQAEKAAAETESRTLRQEATSVSKASMRPSARNTKKARQEIAERFENEKAAAEQEMQNASGTRPDRRGGQRRFGRAVERNPGPVEARCRSCKPSTARPPRS